MKESTKSKILAALLSGSMFLTGCGKETNCEQPTRHVHKYTKEVSEDIVLERYIESEKLHISGYDWNENYITINTPDAEIFKTLDKKDLFDGRYNDGQNPNYCYLYNKMANDEDYLEFYYEYDTLEPHISFDSEGDMEITMETVHHSGWHTDPYDSDNTGYTKLVHHRYYGWRVINKNGKSVLERSEAVDDFRTLLDEYPYFNQDFTVEVNEYFHLNKRDLPGLSPYDFDVFDHPVLDEGPHLTLK